MRGGFGFLKSHIARDLEGKLEYVGDLFKHEELLCEVPSSRGIYIIVSPTTKFQYPKGQSNILYIGTSTNLKRRLKNHIVHYQEAKKDWNKCTTWFCNRYNYMVAFGAEVYYIRTTGNENEKYLESRALEGFYDKFYAIPVGNGAKSFRKSKD